ncbi:MAG: methyltransferase domain-containing protein [Gemmatimonadota bacterium]
MSARPKTVREARSFVAQLGYEDAFHHRRIAETAFFVPRADEGDRLVDLGTHPLVLHVVAEIAGYEDARGVDLREGGEPSWPVRLPETDWAPSREYRIHNADLQRDLLPFPDASVDVVTSFETLEHLLDPMHLLIEANRILKPGGWLVLTTPNPISWRSVLRAAVHKHPLLFPFLLRGHDTNRHNIEYLPSMVRAMVEAAGFAGEVSTRSWWYRVSWIQKLRLVLAGFRPGDRGDIIVVKVRKSSDPRTRYPVEVYLPEG